MSLVTIANPDAVRPRHVALVVIVLFTLLGSCLLTSGARSEAIPDGGKEWPSNSLLRVAVELLNFQYAHPTTQGFEVKGLVFGLGTALAVLGVGIALAVRPRGDDEVEEGDTVVAEPGMPAFPAPVAPAKKHISPLFAAQALMLLYVGWSFASVTWSDAKDVALYGSIQLALATAWPFALAYGLNRSSARFAAYAVVAAGAATAILAIGYTMQRNPNLRSSYPIGNPLFLAACLIPGLLIAAGIVVAQVRDFGNPRRIRRASAIVACLGGLVFMGCAFHWTDSRGPNVALIGGVAALGFVAATRRIRWVMVILGLLAAAWGAYTLASMASRHSSTGRDDSLRLRYYTWGYALDLIGERKLLGHGQGGYTRKADALASPADVLQDPAPLTPRVAHAHNEWLEIWADLGSVGVVLILGALLITLLAGMAALPRMPSLTHWWVHAALLASLAALVAEESASVGLRMAGLPVLFYTVIGLIWAGCMPDRPAPVRFIQRNAPSRAAAAIISLGAAAAITYYSVTDFRSARAEYDTAVAIEDMDWNAALALAETAWTKRLDPHRRLVAQLRLCETYLHVAHVHQVNGLRRLQTAVQSDPPDEHLFSLGRQDADAAENYRRQGWSVLGDLVRKAPNFYNSNWLEYEFEQIRATFARAAGDEESTRQFDLSSAVALRRELDRRPFDANMAGRLVLASASTLSVEDICEVLARPLRYNTAPPLYYDIAERVLTVPAFMEKFAPIYAKAREGPPEAILREDPLAPEKLRLAAIVWFQEDEPTVSERALESACRLYDALPAGFEYAAAAAFAELADRRFFNRPMQPDLAIRDADEAIRRAPRSNEGRLLVAAVKDSRIAMLLAKGDETAARAVIQELRSGLPQATADKLISSRYSALAAGLMQLEAGTDFHALRGWIGRAIQLDPENLVAWQQKADIAFRDEDDVECVRCLREARKRGASSEFIYRFVDIALSQRPTSAALLEFRDELAAELPKARPADGSP